MMMFAVQNGWIYKSPFELGESLVSIADEVKRERIMSRDEETRFIAACTEERQVKYERNGKEVIATIKTGRELLKALVITALDTAMRKGELLKLRWRDVNLPGRIITITAMNSKTAKSREVGITPRVVREFTRLWELSPKDKNLPVFGVTDVKKSFSATCIDAGIEDLRFHDLRHTAITRMVNLGLPTLEIMKISGHTQYTTFARYVNPNTDSVRRIAEILSTFHETSATTSDKNFDYVN